MKIPCVLFTAIISLHLFVDLIDAKRDRIKLKEVGALTFRQNEVTSSRRSYPLPQLVCTGGTARCDWTPKVVQCQNKGFDGVDVQWECKADLKNKYTFGKVMVNCEGYDYPDDPYILVGSCGLEYELDYVDSSRYERRSDDKWRSDNKHFVQKESHSFPIGFLIFAGLVFAFIYFKCLPGNTDNARSTYNPTPSAPPPPGFRSDFYNDDYCSGTSSSYPRTTAHNHSSFTSNLWSGALGAGIGYMFGRNSSTPRSSVYEERRYHSTETFDSSGQDSDTVRTASGFATTKRR